MNKQRLFIISSLPFLLSSITSCGKTDVMELRDQQVVDFINEKDESKICEMLATLHPTCDMQCGIIQIEEGESGATRKLPYIVEMSENEDFSESLSFESFKRNIIPNCLLGGKKYFYRISESGSDEYFQKGSFETRNEPGTFYTISGLHNVRDIGGWKTTDEKTIKNGLIIRGGKTNSYDDFPAYGEDGKDCLVNWLKINGEIDLRGSGDNYGQTHNFISEDKPYLSAPITTSSYILPSFYQTEPVVRKYDTRTKDSFKNIFKFISNKDNYPIYIHCNAGADRTGTICLILEAVLGVPVDSLYKDFELTSFSLYGNRWRSNITSDHKFDDSGVMQDNADNYVGIGKCVKNLWKEYGKGKSFQEAVINYLKKVCEITDEEIAAFQSIMLE